MKKNISKLALIAAMPMLIVSCLKDKKVEDQEYGMDGLESTAKIIQFTANPGSTTTETQIGLPFTPNDTTFKLLGVTLATAAPAPEDIVVTYVANPTLIADYNLANGTSYVTMPSSIYTTTAPDLKVTIPKGSREAVVNFTSNPASIATGTYALAYTLSSISSSKYALSGNFKDILIKIGVKNKYDGIYALKAYVYMGTVNTTAPYLVNIPCSGDYLELATSGTNTVTMDRQPVYRNGSIIYFNGFFPIKLSFDPNTDKVTGVNNLGANAGAYPYVFPDATTTYNSRYDPATKTIYMRYRINNAGTWFAVDTLVYCKSR